MSKSLTLEIDIEAFLKWCDADGFKVTYNRQDYMVASVAPKGCNHKGYQIWFVQHPPSTYTIHWRLIPIVNLYKAAKSV